MRKFRKLQVIHSDQKPPLIFVQIAILHQKCKNATMNHNAPNINLFGGDSAMAEKPRVSLSLTPDVEAGIAQMRGIPRFSRMPMSQVCLYLIRLGLEGKQEWTRFQEGGGKDVGGAGVS